jgi:hypothetical protein
VFGVVRARRAAKGSVIHGGGGAIRGGAPPGVRSGAGGAAQRADGGPVAAGDDPMASLLGASADGDCAADGAVLLAGGATLQVAPGLTLEQGGRKVVLVTVRYGVHAGTWSQRVTV